MPTTPNYALPYPTLSDTPDVPRDIQALASKVDTAILATKNAFQAADTNIDKRLDAIVADIADLEVRVPDHKTAIGKDSCTANANGRALVDHNSGFVPSVIVATVMENVGSSDPVNNVCCMVNLDIINKNQFGVTMYNVRTGHPYTSAVNISYFMRD